MEELPGRHDHSNHLDMARRERQDCRSLHEEVLKAKEAAAKESLGNRSRIPDADDSNVHQEMHLQVPVSPHYLAGTS